MFRLHGLDEYITDMTSYTDSSFKNQEIRLYLDEHPKLRSYVVIDDVDMEKIFVDIQYTQPKRVIYRMNM